MYDGLVAVDGCSAASTYVWVQVRERKRESEDKERRDFFFRENITILKINLTLKEFWTKWNKIKYNQNN